MIKNFKLYESEDYSYSFYPIHLINKMFRMEYIKHMNNLLLNKKIIFYLPTYNESDKYKKYEGIVKEVYNNNINYRIAIILDEPKVLDYISGGTHIYNNRRYVLENNLKITVYGKRTISSEDPFGEEDWDE